MIARALSMLGFVQKQTEPIVPVVHVDWEAKFKRATADLAVQADELERLTAELIHADDSNKRFASEIEGFRTDAQLWRNARDKRSQGRAANNAAPKAKKGVRS